MSERRIELFLCDARTRSFYCALLLAAAFLAPPARADMGSESYTVRWDVTDAGGGTLVSTSYWLTDSLGQTAPGENFSASYVLAAGFQSAPDTDGDLVKDFTDNCSERANADQRDTDGDGFGNFCDPDLNDDNVVNFVDLGIMESVFFTADADADLDGSGSVNFTDLGIVKEFFFDAPGPSGIAP
jgi:hypothetical protein